MKGKGNTVNIFSETDETTKQLLSELKKALALKDELKITHQKALLDHNEQLQAKDEELQDEKARFQQRVIEQKYLKAKIQE